MIIVRVDLVLMVVDAVVEQVMVVVALAFVVALGVSAEDGKL